ncbi:hypothetical protein DMC47_42155 [Nostoc sp. 3335mG]|nr:hypothetical protein DMC47_42155 [Nostoc sp. 3335mG]
MSRVLTIGHSTHAIEQFVDLLRQNDVTAVADVRSSPFSRHNPQFNQGSLRVALKQAGIAYVFLGRELGARSDDPRHYESGRVVYERLARSALFRSGIERVTSGASNHNVALMCAEKDPITCHRTILVARALTDRDIGVDHILADGTIETHEAALDRLMRELGMDPNDLFATPAELRERAYLDQEHKIAYTKPEDVAAE